MKLYKVPMIVTTEVAYDYLVEADSMMEASDKASAGDTLQENRTFDQSVVDRRPTGDPVLHRDLDEEQGHG